MRIVHPVTQLSKKFPVVRYITELSRNFHFGRIKDLLDKLICILTCKGEKVGLELELDTVEAVLRQPDPLALRTLISNTGEDYVRIYEEHHLIAIISPGETRTLPLTAKLLITGAAESSETTVFITTYRRCLCGEDAPAPYAGSEPVGGMLI